MLFIILAVIFSVLALILFAPLKLKISLKNTNLCAKLYLMNIPIYSTNYNSQSSNKNGQAVEDKVKGFEKNTKSFAKRIKNVVEISKTAIRLLKKYVYINDITLNIDLGTGEAASTAISVGVIWAAVYNFLGIIGRIVYINNHSVQVSPDYGEEKFSLKGECIIQSCFVYIIVIVISILLKIKSLKGKED